MTTRFKPPPEPRSKTKSEETPNPIAKSPYLHEHVLTSTAALILGRTRGLRVLIYFNVFNHFGELYPVHPRLRFGRKSSTRLNLQHPETYNDIEGKITKNNHSPKINFGIEISKKADQLIKFLLTITKCFFGF